MPDVPEISKCANPECDRRFHRLGEGTLAVFPVSDPERWGLPGHLRQKVVWLCERCAQQMYVRLDRKHHQIQLVRRHAA